jgi:MFS family permease
MALSTSEVLTRRQLVRCVVASTIGTTIEWYDTVLYALVVGLYLGNLFFPNKDPFLSTLGGFGTLFVSFAARPVGALIFGHFGDRLGRKATLIVTLMAGGIGSFLIGLLPTYAQIGLAAPVLLTVLRLLVGISLGGEWGGSVLLSLEWGNRYKRGFWASWPQVGIPAALVLGFLALQTSILIVGRSSYWAWRLPFLASIVLVLIGLYVRVGVLETPTFSQLLERRQIERLPVLTVLRKQWREVILTCLLRTGEQAPVLIFTTFFLVYATTTLHLAQPVVIRIAMLAAVASLVATPLFGYVSDLVGRRRTFLFGVVTLFVFALPYWTLLNSRVVALVLLASVAGFVINAAMAGPEAAYIAESFTGRLRYSGASLGAGLAAITAGGPASIIALALLHVYHSTTPIGIYIMGCCVVSFLAAMALKERSRQDLSVEYDEEERRAVAVATTVKA